MNYSQLLTTVQGYLENYDELFEAAFPGMVEQAELRIYNSTQLPAMRNTTVTSTVAGQAVYTLPERTLSLAEVSVIRGDGRARFLVNRDVAFLREAYADTTAVGFPESYAMTQAYEITLAPVPDAAYVLNLDRYQYPESIVTAGTTWLSDNFSMALVYGTILEGYTYMKGEADMHALYTARYQEALALLKRSVDGLNRTDLYRTPQTRIQVP